MHIDLEAWAKDLRESEAPVLVGAPVGRSGTTALQRLLNTDPSIAVYSEDTPLMGAAVNASQAVLWLRQNREEFERNRARLKQGGWQGVVTAAPPIYAKEHLEGFLRLAACYKRDAEELGFARWGMKKPDRRLFDFVLFRMLLPKTKIVYIIRDLHECLRSHKSFRRRHVRSTQDVCDLWVHNMRSWQAHKGHCLTIEFDRLENEPESVTAELAEYLSLDLDASVLSKRINSAEGYKAPEPLTDEEERLCEAARAAVAQP